MFFFRPTAGLLLSFIAFVFCFLIFPDTSVCRGLYQTIYGKANEDIWGGKKSPLEHVIEARSERNTQPRFKLISPGAASCFWLLHRCWRLQSRAVGCGRGLDVYNLPSSSAAVTEPRSCSRTRTFPPCVHHTSWLKVSVKWVQRGWKGRESGKNEHGSWPGEQLYIKKRPNIPMKGERGACWITWSILPGFSDVFALS